MQSRMNRAGGIQQNMKKIELSKRWQHPEQVGIACGKMGFGSPTWARATTWFRRPDDVKMDKPKPSKVSNLRKLQEFYKPKEQPKHDPASVVRHEETKIEQTLPSLDKVFSIQKDYWAHLGVALVAPTKPKAAKDKLVAVMEYGHKTAGHSVTMTPEQAAIYKRKTRRAGYGTCLKFSPKV